METILFVCSLLACVVGVLTFVTGLTARAKNDGIVVQKINQAIAGIEELKSDVKTISSTQQSLALAVKSHEEQINTLFHMVRAEETNTQALVTIMDTLKILIGVIQHEN